MEPDDYPTMTCPRCKHEEPDMDGFGVLYCDNCGYCKHSAATNDVCNFCGDAIGGMPLPEPPKGDKEAT